MIDSYTSHKIVNHTYFTQVVTLYGERLSLEEAEELLSEADMDGDGKLDFEEFVKMMSWDLDK